MTQSTTTTTTPKKAIARNQKESEREREMSQFVRYSLLQTGILGGLKELGCGCCWLLLHVVAVPWRIHHRTVRLLIAGFIHRWFDRPIVLVGEPFFVDLQRIDHPVLVEWDDKLSLQQFRRVIIRSGLDQKIQKRKPFNEGRKQKKKKKTGHGLNEFKPGGIRESARWKSLGIRRTRPATYRREYRVRDTGIGRQSTERRVDSAPCHRHLQSEWNGVINYYYYTTTTSKYYTLARSGYRVFWYPIRLDTLTRDVIVSVIMATGVAVPLADKERLRRIVAAQEFLQLSNPMKERAK